MKTHTVVQDVEDGNSLSAWQPSPPWLLPKCCSGGVYIISERQQIKFIHSLAAGKKTSKDFVKKARKDMIIIVYRRWNELKCNQGLAFVSKSVSQGTGSSALNVGGESAND